MNIKMKVKSKADLLNLFTNNPEYFVHLTGYTHKPTGAFINGAMIQMAGKILEVAKMKVYEFPYDYECDEWVWKKEWLEEVNPIWLQQKGK